MFPSSILPATPAPLRAYHHRSYRPAINLNVLVDNKSSWKCVVVQHVARHYIYAPITDSFLTWRVSMLYMSSFKIGEGLWRSTACMQLELQFFDTKNTTQSSQFSFFFYFDISIWPPSALASVRVRFVKCKRLGFDIIIYHGTRNRGYLYFPNNFFLFSQHQQHCYLSPFVPSQTLLTLINL